MRRAEPIAGLGGILLLVSLFLHWYDGTVAIGPRLAGRASTSACSTRPAGRRSR